jgi:hypothetical protein
MTLRDIDVVQIFINYNCQAGEYKLAVDNRELYSSLRPMELIMFINRKRNIVKVLGKAGLYVEHLPDNQTFDLKIRGPMFAETIGKFFGFRLKISDWTNWNGGKVKKIAV